jgi:rubrerythrin
MLETLRSLLIRTPTVVHECRQCGWTVDEDTVRCPACGARSIASYTVE